MSRSRYPYRLLFFLYVLSVTSCMSWDYGDETEDFKSESEGLFIANEGNFQYGNASLSYYDPTTNTVQNNVFFRANGMKLGDVAQSISVFGDRAWIVVNNSHVVFAINKDTFRETGRIENLTSPRYIHPVDEHKAYVTQLWDNRIMIVDTKKYEVTGEIVVPDMDSGTGSTEQMVRYGRYIYCNCWSYQNKIIQIDTETDRVVAQLTVGIQPTSIVLDRFNKLWTITDGGSEDSPYGYEAPELIRIDAESFTIEKKFRFRKGSSPSEIQINGQGDKIYWINNDVWCMDVESDRLPVRPFLKFSNTIYYGLTVDPERGDVYVADAIDYQQPGIIYRYSSDGELLDEFFVGVTPGAFGWK